MHKWRGIVTPIESRNRRHTLCMARLSNEDRHKKTRQLGVLSFFKQALDNSCKKHKMGAGRAQILNIYDVKISLNYNTLFCGFNRRGN